MIGHPEVTKRAYAQDRELVYRAARFAEATVSNGLGPYHDLDNKQLNRLKAQIERDYLVSLLP